MGDELTRESTPPLVEFPPTAAERWELRYHVPRSQVWEGSRGRQRGHYHLHVRVIQPQRPGVTLTAVNGRRTTISRGPGIALCGRNGWYEVADDAHADDADVCPRCLALAGRYGVEVPGHG